jgi:hypothetical protein
MRTLAVLSLLWLHSALAVKPIRPEQQGRARRLRQQQQQQQHAPLRVHGEDDVDRPQPEACPQRCVCHRTAVRCIFLGLKQTPALHSNTTLM